MHNIRTSRGIQDLVDLFDCFIVDQFGVLHDGMRPYPGAVDALVMLKQAGKTILVLSNSGRRSAPNEQRLLRLGFQIGSWDYFLSSGEIAWQRLDTLLRERGGAEPLKCLLMARGGDRSAVEGLPLQIVDSGADADIVLLSGSMGDRFDMDHYRRLLEPAAARKVTCICTNPDKIMLTEVGPRFGAGRIAEVYAEMGAPVIRIGKPFPEIYQIAMEMLGRPRAIRTACVGDSIEHDIAGGRRAGLPTVLVGTGILGALSHAEKADLFRRHGAAPDYFLPAFVW
ncbi:TIGR01459 family HAD-type hydrolase [Bradyrhizobium sp. STM 3562]|uniref:TIGR01459 family HAD-type hydrolase n=1 Tax=Bradyrhizobium sp. STM 3562 TaxID=578924 RepID=UPI00388D91A6